MSVEKVKVYFKQYGMEDKVLELSESSATVELATQALQCEAKRIAKTLSFYLKDRVILIVVAGEVKIDNKKYRNNFGVKAKMLNFNEVKALTGNAVGGVCLFAVNEGVVVYLDVSLKRFETVFPACGSGTSAIELTMDELEKYSNSSQWIDVCNGWND